MEFIADGRAITDFAEAESLDPGARIELFARVCDAVHHGHQKGVIHRDVKPSNILVDSDGNPKIIDFGVARAVNRETERARQTQAGQMIGTLQYMSPEQTLGDPDAIDTRSDVYSLGVVLYELLSGRLPYDVSDSNVVQAARVIQETPPSRLTGVGGRLRGDVETVVKKAMEKDAERRYNSAAELADDLRRCLRGEAIAARPPSWIYELHVFVRRNRIAVAATLLTFVALVIGVAATTTLWIKAGRERQRAEDGETAAREALQLVEKMLDDATVGDLSGEHEALPSIAETTASAVDSGRFVQYPEVEMTLRSGLARMYNGLGNLSESLRHRQRAVELRRELLGADHENTLQGESRLARNLWIQGSLDQAERLARRTWMTSRRVFPEDDARTSHLGFRLGLILTSRGAFDEAEALIRAELARRKKSLGEEDAMVANAVWGLGVLMREKGQLDQAEALLRESTELFSRVNGPDNVHTGNCRRYLGECLTAMGQLDRAEEELLLAEETLRNVLHRQHLWLKEARQALVQLYDAWEKPAEADQWRERLAAR